MKVILAGGSGLIGSALSASLIRDGHQVIVLSRSPRQVARIAGTEEVVWDGKTSKGWLDRLEGVDVLINLAGENIGEGRWSKDKKERLLTSRLDSCRAITEALSATTCRPKRLIQASATGYYGTTRDEPLGEDSPAGDDFLSRLARRWEDASRDVEELGVRRILIRSGIVLSQSHGALPRMALPFRFFVGGPLGSGRQWLPWIHIKDEVGAIRFLMEHEEAVGAFNLTAPNPLRNAEFGRTLAEVMGKPYWAPVPAFALKLVLGEMSMLVLDGQCAIPQKLIEAGYTFQYPGLKKALEDLFEKY